MKYEYHIWAPPTDCVEHWLNVLGDEGWELCQVVHSLGWIFKRDLRRNWNKQ